MRNPTLTQTSPGHWRTPHGFDVAVAWLPRTPRDGEEAVRVLALFGRGGHTAPISLLAASVKAENIASATDNPMLVAMFLASSLLHRGEPIVRWPVVDAQGRVDRRGPAHRGLVSSVDRADLADVLRDVDERQVDRAAHDMAPVIALAQWNLPVSEYGESSDDTIVAMASAAATECIPQAESDHYDPPRIRAWIAERIRTSLTFDDNDARGDLAALRYLIDYGARLLLGNLPGFYDTARADLKECLAGC